MKLPPLTGSEKQIAWAEEIRDGWIKSFAAADARLLERLRLHERLRAGGEPGWSSKEALAVDAQIERERDNLKGLKMQILQDTSAKSWIDHRNLSIEKLYTRIYKEKYM